MEILKWPSQSPDLNPTEYAFHFLKTKTHKQAATEGGCSKGLTVHLKGENSGSGDVHHFLMFIIMFVCQNTFESLYKNGCKTVNSIS